MASASDTSAVALFQMPSATLSGTEVPAKATSYEKGSSDSLMSKIVHVLCLGNNIMKQIGHYHQSENQRHPPSEPDCC